MLTLLLLAQAAAAQPAGKIIFYRGGTLWNAAGACPIRYEGHELVELGRGKFAEWQVKPGRHVLGNKRSSVEVTVAAGETRYVRCQVRGGFVSGGAELQVTDEAAFVKHRDKFERKEITEKR